MQGNLGPEYLKTVTVYTSLPVEEVSVLAQEYEKINDVHVNVVYMSEQDILTRSKVETASPHADVIIANRFLLGQAQKAGALVSYTSETVDIISDRFKDENNDWTGIWYDPIVFAANQDFLKKSAHIPSKWSDLADGKTRLGLTDFLATPDSANLLYTMVTVKGETETLAYLQKIHGQVVQYSKFLATPVRMAGMGECDVSIAVQSQTVKYIRDGFPIAIIYPEDGTSFLLTGAGLVKGATHSEEAKQFIDWLIQDGAQLVLQINKVYYTPTNPEIRIYKDHADKNVKLFDKNDTHTLAQQHEIMEKWVQTVRLSTK